MTDYQHTPTTTGVRAHYSGSVARTHDHVTYPAADAEFDRWLAAHDAEVAATARREALTWAADEVHREARWQAERDRPLWGVERLGVVEQVIRDQITREAS